LTNRELGQLLADADRAPPRMPRDVVGRVRERDRRGRRERRALAGLALAIAGGAAAVVPAFRPRAPHVSVEPAPQVSIAQTQVHLVDLSKRVETKRRLIEELLASERRESLARTIGRLGEPPGVALEADRDRAAGALVEYGSELVRRAGRRREAAVAYARVIDLFPDSPLAAAARRNLNAIER
jgi:hypothetical protein